MKKFFISFVMLLSCLCTVLAIDEYQYKKLLAGINKAGEPQIRGKYVIFTEAESFRHAGISFEFENYKYVHSFMRIPRDNEGAGSGLLFYVLEIPEALSEIHYRLELDGLCCDDPNNPNKFYDYTLGLSVSTVKVPYYKSLKTKVLENGTVQFYYLGEPDQTVYVAGTFNNWDPFMYEMNEFRSGEYFLNLALPRGTWLYAFFVASEQVPDSRNHAVVFSKDGKRASVIEVKK